MAHRTYGRDILKYIRAAVGKWLDVMNL